MTHATSITLAYFFLILVICVVIPHPLTPVIGLLLFPSVMQGIPWMLDAAQKDEPEQTQQAIGFVDTNDRE